MTDVLEFDWKGNIRAPIRQLYLAKMYYFHDGRNAWNWTWSQHYPGSDAFSMSFAEARRKVEKRRVQGSTWTIRELPALAFVSDRISFVVSEVNTDAPFEKASYAVCNSTVLKTISHHFYPPNRNSIYRFVVTDIPEPATLPFQMHSSASVGGQYYLNWSKERYGVNLQHAYSIIAHYTKSVQKKKS